MAEMIDALVGNDVEEISFVPQGANKKKKILFFKSDDTQGDDLMEDKKTFEEVLKMLEVHPDGPALYDDPEKVEEFLKQAKLSDKAVSAVKGALRILNSVKGDIPGGMISSLAKLLGEAPAAPEKQKLEKEEEEKKLEKIEKEAKKAKEAKEAKDALKLDDIPEPIAKALKEQDAKITLLKEEKDELAKELGATKENLLETKETLLRKEFEDKVKDEYSHIPGDPSDLVEQLMTVAKSGDAELSKTIDSILGVADKVAAESKVFEEFGSGSSGSGSAYAKIEKIAEEYRKGDPKMTKEAAIGKATTDNPELWDAYEKEMN